MKKILLTICFGLLLAGPGFAAEYYIDAQNGNDANVGSEADPWQSLDKINTIAGGDSVYLKGDFTGLSAAVTLNAISGTVDNKTKIANWSGESPTIELYTVPATTTYTFDISANYLDISGIEFHYNGVLSSRANAIFVNDTYHDITVHENIIRDARIGIYANGTVGNGVSEIYISNNDISNHLYGIYLNYSSNSKVTGNRVHDGHAGGIYISYGSTNLIANNFAYDNYAYGVIGINTTNFRVINNTLHNQLVGLVISTVTSPVVKNNIISNCNWYGISTTGSTTVSFDYNLYYNNRFTGNVDGTSGTNYNFSDWQSLNFDEHSYEGSDPLFSDIMNDDYSLQDDSPAIDIGLDVSNFISDDIHQETRPQNNGFDIGADERPVVANIDVNADFSVTPLVKKANLSWTNQGATSYNFKYASNPDEDLSGSNVSILNIPDASYDLSGLNYAKPYYYSVQAVYTTSYSSYYSDYSTINLFVTSPKQVKKVKVPQKYLSTDSVKITWSRMSRVTGYNIKLYQKINKKYKVINTIKVANNKKKTKQSKTISDLKSNTQYKIKIRARKVFDDTKYLGKWSSYKKFATK